MVHIVLLFVAQYVETCEPPPDLGTREVHAVVVVPERGRPLAVREGVVEGALADDVQHVVSTVASVSRPVAPDRRHDVCGVAVVFRRGDAAVEVDHRRHRQLVAVADDGAAAAPGLYGGTGEDAVVGPDFGLQARQYLGVGDPLGDLVVVGVRVGARRL
jgi:hypothetical protein